MNAKHSVLRFVAECGPVTSADLAHALGYTTQSGAAATLLRLCRNGHLKREHDGLAFSYSISGKGQTWLSLFG